MKFDKTGRYLVVWFWNTISSESAMNLNFFTRLEAVSMLCK